MRTYKTLAASAFAACILASTAALASPLGEAPHFGPGPSFVPAKPYYYDPANRQGDYSYWQQKHNEELAARTARENDLARRRAEADRLIMAEQMEQQRLLQQQQPAALQPAR